MAPNSETGPVGWRWRTTVAIIVCVLTAAAIVIELTHDIPRSRRNQRRQVVAETLIQLTQFLNTQPPSYRRGEASGIVADFKKSPFHRATTGGATRLTADGKPEPPSFDFTVPPTVHEIPQHQRTGYLAVQEYYVGYEDVGVLASGLRFRLPFNAAALQAPQMDAVFYQQTRDFLERYNQEEY